MFAILRLSRSLLCAKTRGRSHRTNSALVLRDLKKEDAGIYVCVASGAGVFDIEAISDVEVLARGKGNL